jgi:hypothetical protein
MKDYFQFVVVKVNYFDSASSTSGSQLALGEDEDDLFGGELDGRVPLTMHGIRQSFPDAEFTFDPVETWYCKVSKSKLLNIFGYSLVPNLEGYISVFQQRKIMQQESPFKFRRRQFRLVPVGKRH